MSTTINKDTELSAIGYSRVLPGRRIKRENLPWEFFVYLYPFKKPPSSIAPKNRMKNAFLLFALLLLSYTAVCQKRITGVVKDRRSGEPLPFATIRSQTGQGTITDRDGAFEWVYEGALSSFTVSYVGYTTQTVTITPPQLRYIVLLDETVEKLGEVVVSGGENPALRIVRKTLENRDANNPEKALRSFRFTAYNRLLVTAQPDSVNGALDSVYKIQPDGVKKLVRIDSSNFELKQQLDKAHLYITEKVSEYSFNRAKGRRETVLATRMAGFKEPVYELLGIQLQSFSFYENSYTVFGTRYTNPIAPGALSVYDYKILDTLTEQERPSYMIYYKPKRSGKTAGLEGVLYIDTETFALQEAIAQLKGVIDVNAEQEFAYYPAEKVWFPISKQLKLTKGAGSDAVSLFGNAVRIQPGEREKDSTLVRTNPQQASDFMYLIATEKNTEVTLNLPVEIPGRGWDMTLDEAASEQVERFWNDYRTDSLGSRERETYRFIDSMAAKEGVERKVKGARKLLQGYFPTRYLDFDLRYLLKYNGYEGFRLGMGALTNAGFSKKYALNGYLVYGTKDRDVKYGLGAAARLNALTQTWVGASYTDDLAETGSSFFSTDGRSFSLLEPRLFNIEQFHRNRTAAVYLSHDFTPKLQAKLQFAFNRTEPTYPYTFIPHGTPYTDFETATAAVALQWNPFSRYMLALDEKREVEKGYPQFTLQVTQGFEGVLDGDFSFTKVNARAYYQIDRLNRSVTSFLLEGGWAFGELPLTELYHVSPNNPNKTSLMRRFSVAGRNSFETMYFGEFFSDRYISLHAKHQLKPFKISRKFQPELMLVSRMALGDAGHRERHQGVDFNVLDKGYLESGMELNKLFKGFGLSLFYRHGAYHLPDFVENVSFKFTYYFSLGL